MIRLEWKDCRLTAEGTQVVLENAALRTCWRLEPEGLALACVDVYKRQALDAWNS